MKETKRPAVSVEYVKINPEFSNDFKKEIILQSQGNVVELSETMPSADLALAVALIYEVAVEAVLRLDNGQLVLLFSHHQRDFLRPEKVDQSIWKEINTAKKEAKLVQSISKPKPEVVVNSIPAWNKSKKQKNIILQTKNFVKLMPKFLKPGTDLILRSEIPALPLAFLVYFSRPYGHNIFYKDKEGNKIRLFAE